MKKTKRLAAWLLALSLVASLTACGGEDPKGTVTQENSTAQTETSAAEATEQPAEAEPTEAPAETEAPEDTESTEEYQMGSMVGGTYTNEFLGIGCTLDSNWVYLSEEEINEINGIAADMIDDEEISKLMSESDTITDMYAAADDGLVTINIVFENLGVLYGTVMDESAYIDASMETLDDALAAAGYTEAEVAKATHEFAGEERQCIDITASLQDVPIYERLVCIKQGSYMGVITFACSQEDILDSLLELFYAL